MRHRPTSEIPTAKPPAIPGSSLSTQPFLRSASTGVWRAALVARRALPHPLTLAVASLALFPFLGLIPAASAAGPGEIDHVDLRASSRFQGLGGPVEVNATLFIGSDPHRTVFVTNLNVTLDFGQGFKLVAGENPRTVPSLEVNATVSLYEASFAWTLRAEREGDYTLQVTVTSDGSSPAPAAVNVTVRKGVVLGTPRLEPLRPTTSDALVFSVAASSGFDDPNVTLTVTLYVFESPATEKAVSVNGSRLRLWTADKSERIVQGTPLPMRGQNGTYTYALPRAPRGTLIWWIYAETPYSNTTAGLSRIFVQDPATTAAVQWGALASMTALLAGALFLILYDPVGHRPAKGWAHNSPDRVRVCLLLLAVGFAFVVAATLTGAPAGLWRWFGYL